MVTTFTKRNVLSMIMSFPMAIKMEQLWMLLIHILLSGAWDPPHTPRMHRWISNHLLTQVNCRHRELGRESQGKASWEDIWGLAIMKSKPVSERENLKQDFSWWTDLCFNQIWDLWHGINILCEAGCLGYLWDFLYVLLLSWLLFNFFHDQWPCLKVEK